MKFNLRKKDGYIYAKKSGDFNKIHLDPLEGHNSIFGKNICHGTLIINKFLKKIKINKILNKKKIFSLNFEFQNAFEYNKDIYINKNLKKIYQNNLTNFNSKNAKYKKFQVSSENLTTKYENIKIMLNYLSRYVGMVFPGKYSIINSININYNIKNNFSSDNVVIRSTNTSRKPVVHNRLIYGKYIIDFTTLRRPKLKIKPSKVKKNLIKKIKSIEENILIIGASSGIGLELLKIFEHNEKIKIFATYFKNKITSDKKNIFFIKLDINKNLKKIKKILQNNEKLRIFYMPTPKINMKNNKGSAYKVYKKFYIDNVLKIFSFCDNNEIKFFYPSTTAIYNFQSNYTKTKLMSEKKLKKFKKKSIKTNILRISPVNTKQTLSIMNNKIPTFTNLFNQNKEYQKRILFL